MSFPVAPLGWQPVLLQLPQDSWTLVDGVPRTRVKVGGYALDVAGLKVRSTDPHGYQEAVSDPETERLLLEVYDPEEPWQTWTGFGATFALYATPSADQNSPATVEVALSESAWDGPSAEFGDPHRKLVSVVVLGHCALHLEARLVSGPGQEFAGYPEDRESVAALAGWDGPFPTMRIGDGEFVLFAYPHGD